MRCPKCDANNCRILSKTIDREKHKAVYQCPECSHEFEAVVKRPSYRIGTGWNSVSELTSRPDIVDKLGTIARDAVENAMRRYFAGDISLDEVWQAAIDGLDMTGLDEEAE